MKKILVPTDFEKPATWAIEMAAMIADKMNAEIILLHIIELPTPESFNAEAQVHTGESWEDKIFTLKMIERGRQQLRDAAMRLTEQGLPVVHQELRLGNIFHGIRQMITDHDVDLTVMGTSGLTKFEEILVGSNTEKVVRFSKCPVLTVHQRWDSLKAIKDIVYATSMVENEKDFSAVVKRTQEIFGAKVHLVRINTPMNFQPDLRVKRVMEEFAHKNRLTNYTLNIFNDYTEDEGIIHFANDIKADLIAMATHGRTGLSHVLAGSIAEDVVNHAARPVLTWVIH